MTTAHVTITVLDTATVIEAAEAVFRYDLPGTGVVEGWALSGVMEQTEKQSGPAWPDVTVAVLADRSATAISDEAVAIICRQLRLCGVRVVEEPAAEPDVGEPSAHPVLASVAAAAGISEDIAEEAEPHQLASPLATHPEVRDLYPPTEEYLPVSETRDGDEYVEPEHSLYGPTGLTLRRGVGGRHFAAKRTRWSSRLEPFHLVLVAVLVIIGGVSWWALNPAGSSATGSSARGSDDGVGTAGTGGSADAATSVRRQSLENQSATEAAEGAGAGDSAGKPENSGREENRLDLPGMTVVVPQGFEFSEKDGLITAAGHDPDLRILFAADPLYSVPAEALFAEVRAQIEADKQLGDAAEANGRLSYIERPGDDSQVQWTTWVDKGHQLSVGCHTKKAPTTVHKAACRMAADTLVKTP